ncbi:MAG TPA: 5-oxoprolinase subunit PxpA [Candidatus Didemnitutus sp.]|nr:5-oxoprolinase subunit PxpA [Candidatus Didemnitutus sp.]
MLSGRVDLNCDLGEGAGHDAELMALVTSANIACGGHTGDEATMRKAVGLAKARGVAIGAHPSFVDRENFGRIEQVVWPDDVFQLVLSQTRALQRVAGECGRTLAHVKPHGALYNMAARNSLLADAVAQAVYEADPRLRLFSLAGSCLIRAAESCGLVAVSEVFADRTYQADGSLTPRSQSDALIADAESAVQQVIRMIREGCVQATDGTRVSLRAESICLHGDGPDPVGFAQRLRDRLHTEGVEIRAPGA